MQQTVETAVILHKGFTRAKAPASWRYGLIFALLVFSNGWRGVRAHDIGRPPNVILIVADDLGYSDLGCYGSRDIPTPHLDRMAAEGVRCTSFYSASSVCSASRAALLTGCYPQRVGIPGVISANVHYGINSDEELLPELLRARRYATAIFGKWHLGNQPQFNPLNHGFDEWLGTVGSNDMGRGRPSLEDRAAGKAGVELFRDRTLIETNPDQRFLTQRYTAEAVRFIREQKSRPFFLYVPHNMPHTPLFVSPRFEGRSGCGLYGDVVAELDWSVGQILGAIERHQLAENTVVIFTSDNGPWLIFGDQGGAAGPFRGGKKQTLEGGHRVPCLIRWPKNVPAGTTIEAPIVAFDLLPTIVQWTGARPPTRPIDGLDLSDVLLHGRKPAPRPIAFYFENELRAVRRGPWKLQYAHQDRHTPAPSQIGTGGRRGAVITRSRPQVLYDLRQKQPERQPANITNASTLMQLQADAQNFRKALGDELLQVRGRSVRPPGRAPRGVPNGKTTP